MSESRRNGNRKPNRPRQTGGGGRSSRRTPRGGPQQSGQQSGGQRSRGKQQGGSQQGGKAQRGTTQGGSGGSKGRSRSDGPTRGRGSPPRRSESGDRGSGKQRRERSHEGRHGKDSQARSGQRRAFSVDGGAANLPRWLKEEIQRVTPRERQEPAINLLAEAAADYADEQFRSAHRKLIKAKGMSSRASAIRELLGLTAYRLGIWDEALRELRAFRRFTGDTTHMPVEMDALRGLRRDADVEKTWNLFMELGGSPSTDSEARVVYGSYLLDQNRAKDAWHTTRPKRVTKEARPHEVRRWFVAARAALALGDTDAAGKLVDAVRNVDPELPGLEELSAAIAGA